MTPVRRLRVSHVLVQPVLVWDDGEDLEPGPTCDTLTLPLAKLAGLVDTLPAELVELAAQLEAAESQNTPATENDSAITG